MPLNLKCDCTQSPESIIEFGIHKAKGKKWYVNVPTSVSVLNLETAILLSKTNNFGSNTGRLYLN